MNRWDSEPLWMFLDPPATVEKPELEPELSEWEIQKQANRLERKIAQAEAGTIQPRAIYAASAPAVLKDAKKVWREVTDAIRGR